MMYINSSKVDKAEQDELIMKPNEYIRRVSSKYHKTMGLAFNQWLNVSEENLDEVGEILQILHTATLLLDDVHDESKYRYGIPVAHHVYGLGLTLNAASNIIFIVLKMILKLGNPMAVSLYCDTMLDSHRGQGLELYWRENYACPTEEEYFDMIKQKAAPFFVLAFQMLQLFSDNKENYIKIAELIGVYYAVRDEYCNLFNQEAIKTLADNTMKQHSQAIIKPDIDITEGKFSLPIIHAIRTSDRAEEIINILKQRTSDVTLINYCISLLEELGSAKYTADVILHLENDIHQEIKRLGGNPILTKLINELGNWRKNEGKSGQ